VFKKKTSVDTDTVNLGLPECLKFGIDDLILSKSVSLSILLFCCFFIQGCVCEDGIFCIRDANRRGKQFKEPSITRNGEFLGHLNKRISKNKVKSSAHQILSSLLSQTFMLSRVKFN